MVILYKMRIIIKQVPIFTPYFIKIDFLFAIENIGEPLLSKPTQNEG